MFKSFLIACVQFLVYSGLTLERQSYGGVKWGENVTVKKGMDIQGAIV